MDKKEAVKKLKENLKQLFELSKQIKLQEDNKIEIKDDEGNVLFVDKENIEIGDVLYKKEGEEYIVVPNGDYKIGGKIYKILDGKVVEIQDEVKQVDEQPAETPEEEAVENVDIEELKTRVTALESMVQTLKEGMDNISKIIESFIGDYEEMKKEMDKIKNSPEKNPIIPKTTMSIHDEIKDRMKKFLK